MVEALDVICCGCQAKSGILISAFYTVFMAVLCMSLMLLRFSAGKDHANYAGLTVVSYTSLVIYSLLIVFSFILIAGANTGKRRVYMPWVLHMVVVIIFEGVATGLVYFSNHRKGVHPWDLFCSLFYGVRTAVNIYCVICVTVQCALLTCIAQDEKKAQQRPRGKTKKEVYSIEDGYSSDEGGDPGDGEAEAGDSSRADTYSVDVEPMLGAPPPYAHTPPPYITGIQLKTRKGSKSSIGTDGENDTLISDSDRYEILTMSDCTEITDITIA